MRLVGKVALVTGGGTGIGRATALRLAREGAAVGIMGRRIWPIENVLKEIEKAGGRAIAVTGDVAREADAQGAVAATVSSFGGLDILFNNAGVTGDGDALDVALEIWERTLAINLTGPFLMSRAAIPELRRRGGGSIINNASTLGLVGLKGAAAYCASKGGVVMLTRAMALDHAAEKIRINAICPAVVDTDMPRRWAGLDEGDEGALNATFGSIHPLGRVGTPDEIAAVVAFLAGDESGFVTGAVWPIDGGITAA